MSNSDCIVAIGAHADDIDLQAGGILARFARTGHRIIYVVATTSASGVPGCSPDEAYEIRHDEARRAANVYGAFPVFLDFHQCLYPPGARSKLPSSSGSITVASSQETTLSKVQKLIARHDPKVVLTHNPDDLHEDHYHTAALVFRAVRRLNEIGMDPQLWLWRSSHRGSILGAKPTDALRLRKEDVDVQDEAIHQHRSQVERTPWMKGFAVAQAKEWGKAFGYPFAQPFLKTTLASTSHEAGTGGVSGAA